MPPKQGRQSDKKVKQSVEEDIDVTSLEKDPFAVIQRINRQLAEQKAEKKTTRKLEGEQTVRMTKSIAGVIANLRTAAATASLNDNLDLTGYQNVLTRQDFYTFPVTQRAKSASRVGLVPSKRSTPAPISIPMSSSTRGSLLGLEEPTTPLSTDPGIPRSTKKSSTKIPKKSKKSDAKTEAKVKASSPRGSSPRGSPRSSGPPASFIPKSSSPRQASLLSSSSSSSRLPSPIKIGSPRSSTGLTSSLSQGQGQQTSSPRSSRATSPRSSNSTSRKATRPEQFEEFD